jgi:hypothetical protein
MFSPKEDDANDENPTHDVGKDASSVNEVEMAALFGWIRKPNMSVVYEATNFVSVADRLVMHVWYAAIQ